MEHRITSVLAQANVKILSAIPSKIAHDNVLNGKLGLAYYCIHLFNAHGNEAFLNKTKEVLEIIFEDVNSGQSYMSTRIALADGITGLGLVLKQGIEAGHISQHFQDQVDIITDSAFEACIKMIDDENFDYFYGAAGILFYLVEVGAEDYYNEIINRLYIYAADHAFLFYNNTKDSYTKGINFGFAHGTPAILSVLISLYEIKRNDEILKPLIMNSINALLQFGRDNLSISDITMIDTQETSYITYFPYNVITEDRSYPISAKDEKRLNRYHYSGRLGWCNSDLGHVLMLYKAGRLFGIQQYTELAAKIGAETIKRNSKALTKAKNYFMCHGSSGIAQLYYKIYLESGAPSYMEAYLYWTEITLHHMEEELKKEFNAQRLDLLTGWLGALLSLCDYNKTSENKAWDKIFLI